MATIHDRPLTPAERIAALELAVSAIASRFDFKANPPRAVTPQEVRVALGLMPVDELEARRLVVEVQMFTLLGSKR